MPATTGRRSVVTMGEPPGLTIVLELAVGTSPLRGSFRNASGTPATFVGWPQLKAAIEHAVDAASAAPSAPDAPARMPVPAPRAFEVRIVPGSEPVSGEVQDGCGPPAAFHGWLELATLLDAIRLRD